MSRDKGEAIIRGVGMFNWKDKSVSVLGSIHAVSYTHLRAHETVLDLVCRLLLEKKKLIGNDIHMKAHDAS